MSISADCPSCARNRKSKMGPSVRWDDDAPSHRPRRQQTVQHRLQRQRPHRLGQQRQGGVALAGRLRAVHGQRPCLILSADQTDAVRRAVRDADREAPWVLALQDGRSVRVTVPLGLRGVVAVEIVKGRVEGQQVIPQTEKAAPGDRVRPGPGVAENKRLEIPAGMTR